MFDEYVSLGSNCEVAFQLDRAFPSRRKHLFDWKITPLSALLDLLESRFAGIAEAVAPGEHDGMSMDARYGFQFHNQPVHQEREKCAYLGERFMAPTGRRCYILKPQAPPSDSDLARLRRLLDRLAHDYALVVLRRPDDPVPLGPSHTLRFYAPAHAANEGDEAGYDDLFVDYPIYSTCRECHRLEWLQAL
jgi:hypothetical protein